MTDFAFTFENLDALRDRIKAQSCDMNCALICTAIIALRNRLTDGTQILSIDQIREMLVGLRGGARMLAQIVSSLENSTHCKKCSLIYRYECPKCGAKP